MSHKAVAIRKIVQIGTEEIVRLQFHKGFFPLYFDIHPFPLYSHTLIFVDGVSDLTLKEMMRHS